MKVKQRLRRRSSVGEIDTKGVTKEGHMGVQDVVDHVAKIKHEKDAWVCQPVGPKQDQRMTKEKESNMAWSHVGATSLHIVHNFYVVQT